jgi:hypothetical protein
MLLQKKGELPEPESQRRIKGIACSTIDEAIARNLDRPEFFQNAKQSIKALAANAQEC